MSIHNLHSAQQDVYYNQLIDPKSCLYNVGLNFIFKGVLNIELLKEIIENLPFVFDAYNLEFDFTKDTPACQIKQNPEKLNLEEIDFSTKANPESTSQKWIEKEYNTPFNIDKDLLYKFTLIKIKEDEYWLVKRFHHLILDGIGFVNNWDYIISEYQRRSENKEETFEVIPSYYNAIKQNALYLKSLQYLIDEKYWKDKYSEIPNPLLTYNKQKDQGIGTFSVKISDQDRTLFNQLSLDARSNISQLTIAALLVFFGKTKEEQIFSLGVPAHNRGSESERKTVGMFSRIYPFKGEYDPNQLLKDLLITIRQTRKSDYIHGAYPLSHLNRALKLLSKDKKQLFDIVINYQPFPFSRVFPDLKIEAKLLSTTSDLEAPLCINWLDYGDAVPLELKIDYKKGYIDNVDVKKLAERLLVIIKEFCVNLEKPLKDISIFTNNERTKLLNAAQTKHVAYPSDKTLPTLFEVQVEKTPDAIALDYEGEKLTYKALNEKSNQLARQIRAEYKHRTGTPLAPDTLIGLYLEKSPEMIIGILGILKAGGAYVPIDINNPIDRVSYMLHDTGTELILSKQSIQIDTNIFPAEKVLNIDLEASFYKEEATDNLPCQSNSRNLAYVIYTSGTTGNPKGVMVEHHSVTSLVYNSYIDHAASNAFAFFSSPVFDAAIFEIWTPLLSGTRLIIPKNLNQLISDIVSFKNFIVSKGITTLWLTKTLFESLYFSDKTLFKSLKYLLIGGEALDKVVVNELIHSDHKSQHFINCYGPTECTTFATTFNLDEEIIETNVPIGKAIAHRSIYVLDKNKDLVPEGVIGELYIGGAGVARGYLGREKLTKERFIENPFANETDIAQGNTRLYRSGDLVRWLPDGNLEYIGRNDAQVKLRGYRIELGEIEQSFLNIPEIQQSCVLVKTRETASGTTKFLVGYYVLETNATLSEESILASLKESLPDYMVPSTIVGLESFPLTVNGKLDKRALPDPGFNELEHYVAPETIIEQQLCVIWQEVLGVEKVGVTDDFFKLGGNSILAIQASHRMSEALNTEIKVADLFANKTIRKLDSQDERVPVVVISKSDSKKSLLSFSQERLWFIEKFEEGSNAYHIPTFFELTKEVNQEGIEYAIQKIISRHEVLRSFIIEEAGKSVQVVQDHPLSLVRETVKTAKDLNAALSSGINTPFDLTKSYPIRVIFYKVEDTQKHYMLINTHHIASDGWSMGIFEKEFSLYYKSFISGDSEFELPSLTIQYKDFANWQHTNLTDANLEVQLFYWKNKLAGFETLNLATDYPRPHTASYRGRSQSFVLPAHLSDSLRKLVTEYGVTMHSMLLSATHILLSKFTGQEDIVTGSVIAGRHHRQTTDLIGFFVNTQVNRTILNSTQSFKELVSAVYKDQVAAQRYQDIPFEKLVTALEVDRDASRHPIFQVAFSVQNLEDGGNDLHNHIISRKEKVSYNVEKFDLSLFFDDSQKEIKGVFGYATSLFSSETIDRLISSFTYLLETLVVAPTKSYDALSLLDPDAYNKLAYEKNVENHRYPSALSLPDLFEAQVEKTPKATALVYEGETLTYQELNEKSNQLARHIRAEYVQRTGAPLASDTLIGLYLDKGLEMIIGILGILKAGGAYVPIDVNNPKDRVSYMLKDTGAALVLSQKNVEIDASILPSEKVLFIDLQASFYTEEAASNLQSHSSSKDLAYVIYTSGTTGYPKGVMVEHHSVTSLVYNTFIEQDASDAFAFFSSPVFDAAIFEIWTPLLRGTRLIIPKNLEQLVSDKVSFKNFIISQGITTLWLTKTLFESLYFADKTLFKSLKHLLIGGEALDRTVVNELIFSNHKPLHFMNGYGPTECTTFACMYRLEEAVLNANVPIGQAIAHRSVYVVDKNGNLVPEGVIGELYIGGAGVARGYLDREELTKERFIENKFASDSDKTNGNTRLYKSGDLVRWLPDGNLEYIGRNDAQIKLRGYRIELGEIEQTLLNMPEIQQSSVLIKERETVSGVTKYLVGYYVLEPNTECTEETILGLLQENLPDYMVPSALVALDSFPLTINGKLDKRALPAPEFRDKLGYIAPETEVEKQLCSIWQSVLGIHKVGVTDDFFKLGGNSILAIQVSYQMSDLLNKEIKVANLFASKTIRKLISQNDQQPTISIPSSDSKKSNLSFSQERLWFIEKFEEGSNAYHIPIFFELTNEVDKDAVIYALQKIISRHEVLRSVIIEEAGKSIQVVQDTTLPIEYQKFKTQKESEAILVSDINTPFDLTKAYPIRVTFYEIDNPKTTFLLINIHHIASDGWSMGIFKKEFTVFYDAYMSGDRNFELPKLDIQYKDYATWQHSYLTEANLEDQVSYWKNKLSGFETLNLTTDFPRPHRTVYRGKSKSHKLSQNLSKKLRDLVTEYGVTMHSMLLSATHILLSKYTGQKDIVTGSLTAGRHHRQTKDLIGFFVNTQVNRTLLNTSQSFKELVMSVYKDQIAAQRYQDVPFEKLVTELGVERYPSRHPIFQVAFSVQSLQDGFNDLHDQIISRNELVTYDVEKFDLSIFIDDSEDEIKVALSYATSLFSSATMKKVILRYEYILEQLVKAPSKPYDAINLLSKSQYNALVYDRNRTGVEYPSDQTLSSLFESQVAVCPNDISLVYEGTTLSYGELNAKSNQVAHYLRTEYTTRTGKAIEGDTLIGLCMNRSLEMIVGILGILKAGGVYVPIDPSYPKDRIDYILNDTDVALVVSQSSVSIEDDTLPKDKTLYIDLGSNFYDTESKENLPNYSSAKDLAYIIYTSGTTGRPKGVMVEHKSVCNTIYSLYDLYDDRISSATVYTSFVFDVSVSEIFACLLTGKTLHVLSDTVRKDVDLLSSYLITNKINLTYVPPVILAQLPKRDYPDLFTLLYAGEPCDKQTASWWSSKVRLF